MAPVRDVADLLSQAAVESPDKLALVEATGRSVTWAELEEEVARVATGLGAAGVLAGHRVMLALGNRIEFVACYLGVLRAQAVAVPVNPLSTPAELVRMVRDSGARLAIADVDSVAAVRDTLALLDESPTTRPPRVVVVGATLRPGERSYDHLRSTRGRPAPPLLDPEKLATLLYTSGTSGEPRAAMLTHRALLANVAQVAAVQPPMMHGDDVVLGLLPLFHVYGLGAVLGGVLCHRAKLVLVERFDVQGTLDIIEDEACSVVPIAPPVLARWLHDEHLAERLGPVRLILSGAAPIAPELVQALTEATGVPIHQGYGLTEACPVVTSTLCSTPSGDGADPKPAATSRPAMNGSVGAALPGVEIRLVDARGGTPAGTDPGQVEIRGDNLFSGYWPDGRDGPAAADGWWPTGDVGFLDERGDLFLVDRLRELVIVSGFNVYPVEVETVVRGVAGVAEVAVIGVPGAEVGVDTGEAVVAYVVPRGPDTPVDLLEADVLAACRERLAGFKVPTRVVIVEALPHTATGKVSKGRLRELGLPEELAE